MKKTHTATRASIAWEWLVASLLAANLLWTSLCLGGVRAQTQVWTSALTGAALAALLLRALFSRDPACAGGRARWAGHWAGWCALPFLLYAAANALWVTPVRWLGERDWWQWFLIAATFWIALNGPRRRRPRQLLLATILLLGVAAAILAAHQLNGHPAWLMLGRAQAPQYAGRASGFFGNPNTLAAFFALIIPPLLACAWQRGAGIARCVLCGYLALAFALAAAATLSRGGLIALALALVCWPLLVREWPWRRRALACAAALLAAALAFCALWLASPAARARLGELDGGLGEKSRVILWRASLQMTASAPLLGTGAGSFNTLFEQHRPEGFCDEPQWTHNEYLNTLGDYGIAGVLLLLGSACVIAWRCRARDSDGVASLSLAKSARHAPLLLPDAFVANAGFARGLGVGLLALALASAVDFHMKIPAIGMIAAVCLAEFIKRREAPAPPPDATAAPCARLWPRRIFLAACALLLALLFTRAINAQRAEAARADGREKIDTLALRATTTTAATAATQTPADADTLRTLTQADALFERALSIDPANAQTWADHAYSHMLQARARQASPDTAAQIGHDAEQNARAALALSDAVPEFWLRLGVALDLQGRAADAGDAFARALRLAPASALVWYHQAYHLSLAPATRALAQSALDTCLRLDPGFANAKNLRQQLDQKSKK